MDKNWIKEGMEVAHRDNITQKMIVEQMVKRSSPDRQMIMVLGFKCHWWQEEKDRPAKYQFGIFHSRELVPWDIAMYGFEAVKKFLENRANEQ